MGVSQSTSNMSNNINTETSTTTNSDIVNTDSATGTQSDDLYIGLDDTSS